MAFVDQIKFHVKAGDGGNGCISFRREKFVPRGGPNGGDGGKGGDVYLEADPRKTSLIDFKFRVHFKGENGQPGMGKDQHGRGGRDETVAVPVGSQIRDASSGVVLADLIEAGQRYLAARGGRGGLGNKHFASASNRAPRRATPGGEGEELWLQIELKLLADVGLIGLPNAGKSTLLSRLSAANPKVAPYPFTTLDPQLGVLNLGLGESCIIADIPGIIKGAHQGTGLGLQFLRHIERTSLLVFVLDGSDLQMQPLDALTILEEELSSYKAEMGKRERIVVCNKIDLLDQSRREEVIRSFATKHLQPILVSAKLGTGIPTLQECIREALPHKMNS